MSWSLKFWAYSLPMKSTPETILQSSIQLIKEEEQIGKGKKKKRKNPTISGIKGISDEHLKKEKFLQRIKRLELETYTHIHNLKKTLMF